MRRTENAEPIDTPPLDERERSALQPLRFLGMGVFVAWLCCTHIKSIYLPSTDAYLQALNYGLRVGDIGTFIVLALLASRIGCLSRHPATTTALVALTCAGTALLGLVLIPQEAGDGLVFAASVVTGIGGALLFCLWAEAYCQMGTMRMVMYGGGSCITAFAVYVLVSTMREPYAIIATSLLPIVSLACAQKTFRVVEPERAQTAAVGYPVPWKIVLIMGIAGFVSGLSGILLGEDIYLGAVHRIWVTGLAGVVLVGMALLRPRAFDMRAMTKICLVTAVVAIVIMPLSAVLDKSLGYAVSFLAKFAYVWFTVFALAMLAHLAYRFEIPSLRLFAVARAVSEAGIFLGVIARGAILDRFNDGLDVTALVVASLVFLLLVLACVLIWRSEKAVNEDWGAAGISLVNGERVLSDRERLERRCEQLGEQRGLTEREVEVLKLVAQHKSRLEIEQELFLSQNTVKTHLRRIYAKLDVHSKEEVWALVEE